jgi:hypothetical protein
MTTDMTREQIMTTLERARTSDKGVWLGTYTFENDPNSRAFECVIVDDIDLDAGTVTTIDSNASAQNSPTEIKKIFYAVELDPEVWRTWATYGKSAGPRDYKLRGIMMSESGEISVSGQITSIDRRKGTVHFEADFMLDEIKELKTIYEKDDAGIDGDA